MTTEYAKVLAAAERLTLLQVLEQDSDYAHNEGVLSSLLEALGQAVSRDKLRTHLYWLQEQGLIEIKDVAGVLVAKLSARGADVALGRTLVPGVKRPSPED